MHNVELKAQMATDITVKIDIDPQKEGSIEVESNSPFNINFSRNQRQGIAILEQKVQSKEDPEQFFIDVKIKGYFDFDAVEDDDQKKEVHIECYYRLFPYVQSLVAHLCVSAGLPPLMVTPLKMSADNVILSPHNETEKE